MENSLSARTEINDLTKNSSAPSRPLEERYVKGLELELERDSDNHENQNLPRLEFKVFYSSHEFAEDVKGLDEECKKADIIIPEALGWDKDYLDHLNRISQGTEDLPEEVRKSESGPDEPFGFFMYRIIHNTKKPITFIDVPDGDKSLRDHPKEANFIDQITNLKDYMKKFRQILKEDSKFQRERESYMVSHVRERIALVLENNPELKKKKSVKIIIQLGSFHTNFYRMMSAKGEHIEREFTQNPYVFDFQNEITRRFYFSIDVDDDLILRGLYELNINKILAPVLFQISSNSHKISLFLRKLALILEPEEIRIIFGNEMMLTGNINIDVFLIPLANILDVKGFGFPENEKQLDAFLALKI